MTDAASEGLIERFGLSHDQAQAILDMRLQRLTGLGTRKIENEYNELMVKIAEYREILANEHLVLEIISNGAGRDPRQFGDDRRTEITVGEESILDEDLIPREDVIITITHSGYIKRLPVSHTAARNVVDVVSWDGYKRYRLCRASVCDQSHNYLMFFTIKVKCTGSRAYEIPELRRTARGTPIINLIQIEQGETINAVIPVQEFEVEQILVLRYPSRDCEEDAA